MDNDEISFFFFFQLFRRITNLKVDHFLILLVLNFDQHLQFDWYFSQ